MHSVQSVDSTERVQFIRRQNTDCASYAVHPNQPTMEEPRTIEDYASAANRSNERPISPITSKHNESLNASSIDQFSKYTQGIYRTNPNSNINS